MKQYARPTTVPREHRLTELKGTEWATRFGLRDIALLTLCRANPKTASLIVNLYQVILGRPPDPPGMRAYLEQVTDKRPLKSVASEMLGSGEYRSSGRDATWWRLACRHAGLPEVRPRLFESRADYVLELATRLTCQPQHGDTLEFSDILGLMGPPIEPEYDGRLTNVTVVIPVYGGLAHLQRLLPSLARNTHADAEIIFVDDASPEGETASVLAEFANSRANTKVLTNASNLGFVLSVERGIAAGRRHFAILNSDTDVPARWLERMMAPIFQNACIASTTPFSNAATIFSFPRPNEDNESLAGKPADAIDIGFRHLRTPVYREELLNAPTGVGFCMGVNGDVWRKIGGFDSDAFGRGYAEENDWCQRAIANGFRNVIVPNLFVTHAHGATFSAAEKSALLDRNSRTLARRWPGYLSDVKHHIASDPWRRFRAAAFLKLCCSMSPVVIVDHMLGGGANAYRQKLVRDTLAAGKPTIIVAFDRNKNRIHIELAWADDSISLYCDSAQLLLRLPDFSNGAHVIYNNAVSWPDKALVIELLKGLGRRTGVRLQVLIHDFFPVCPAYTLLDDSNRYCGVPDDATRCRECSGRNKNATEAADVPEWRRDWSELLEDAGEVTCFSKSSRDIVARAFPQHTDKLTVVPHEPLVANLRRVRLRPAEQLVIGVVGALNLAKGIGVVNTLGKAIIRHGAKATIVVIGQVDPAETLDATNVHIHGRYEVSDLPDLFEFYGVSVCLFPSIGPETFSYVTQEIMACGMPVVCFDLGAQAERIQTYELGMVCRDQEPETLLICLEECAAAGARGKFDCS